MLYLICIVDCYFFFVCSFFFSSLVNLMQQTPEHSIYLSLLCISCCRHVTQQHFNNHAHTCMNICTLYTKNAESLCANAICLIKLDAKLKELICFFFFRCCCWLIDQKVLLWHMLIEDDVVTAATMANFHESISKYHVFSRENNISRR